MLFSAVLPALGSIPCGINVSGVPLVGLEDNRFELLMGTCVICGIWYCGNGVTGPVCGVIEFICAKNCKV
jgi:hypothetical protein